VRPFVNEVIARLGQSDAAYREIIQRAKQVVAQGYDLERILPEVAHALVGRTPTPQEIATVRVYYNR
jgi:UDP-N-acetyl-D-mannosaminuronic acid transferase (WecB/TagA/CpsF family)